MVDLNSLVQTGGGKYKDKSGSEFTLREGGNANLPADYVPAGGGSDSGYYSRLPDLQNSNPYSDAEVEQAKDLTKITPFDEESKRLEMLRFSEGRLKEVNKTYDVKREEAIKSGEKDLARSNTISALTGMMGAPEATTRAGESEKRTAKDIANVEELRSIEINKIYDKIDENIYKEKQASLETNRTAAANLLKEIEQNATEGLKGLAQQGISWDKFKESDPDTLNTLIKQTGKSEFSLRSIYYDSMPEQYKPTIHTDYKDNGDGTTKMTRVSFDPLTRKTSVENYDIMAPVSMFQEEEKPIVADGKLLVKQSDGSYKDMTPYSDEDLKAQKADVAYKEAQTAKIYADIKEKDEAIEIVKDLQDADAFIKANPKLADDVRKKFIQAHPDKGDLFLKYFKYEF